MSNQSLCLQMCVLCVVICLSTSSQAQDDTWSRLKRGFRINSASRVAHGYGKRGYGGLSLAGSSRTQPEDFTPYSADQLQAEPDVTDVKDYDWSLMSVEELVSLLQSHPKLTTSVVKKLIDTDQDGIISADELFRPRK